MRNLIVLIGIIGLLSSCSTQNLLQDSRSEKRALQAALDSAFLFDSNYVYRIRKDDKLSISVWGQDELSVGSVYGIYNSNEVYGKWLMVNPDGQIAIPKIGIIQVEGLSLSELRDSLAMRYAEWVKEPVVDIKIHNKEVSILGEVRNPQVITYQKEAINLLETVARCGGFEFYADLRYVKILRQTGPHVRIASIDLSRSKDYLLQNIQLYPGDVVLIPSRNFKAFDKRVSTIIPFTSTITAAAIFLGAL